MVPYVIDPQWENYKLHNFPIGSVLKFELKAYVVEPYVSTTRVILSLYEMNKGRGIYNSSFIQGGLMRKFKKHTHKNENVDELVEMIKTFNAGAVDAPLSRYIDKVYKEWKAKK